MAHGSGQFPKFIVKPPHGPGQEVDITKPSFTIGRKADNDLRLEDPAVSGYHARVVKVQEVLFLEDLRSTNGTLINDHKVDRKQLQDADMIKIGQYRIIYRVEAANPCTTVSPPVTPDTDETVVFTASAIPDRAPAGPSIGHIRVLSGKTSHSEYRLTKQISVIGAQEDAAIRLTGWFAPRVAAIIAKRSNGYLVTLAEGGKPVFVNQAAVRGQASLAEGDIIEVAGVRMYFSMRGTPA
jgi:hypothetical protein